MNFDHFAVVLFVFDMNNACCDCFNTYYQNYMETQDKVGINCSIKFKKIIFLFPWSYMNTHENV